MKEFRWPCFPRGLSVCVQARALYRGSIRAVGRVVEVTAVAIATGWKLEKGKRRSLKAGRDVRAPAIQELLTPNPLDVILLLAVLKFALSAEEQGSAPHTGYHTSPEVPSTSFPRSHQLLLTP